MYGKQNKSLPIYIYIYKWLICFLIMIACLLGFTKISYADDILYENGKFKAYYPTNWVYDKDYPNVSYGNGTWANCMYGDGYHSTGYADDTPYQKILWLTKEDILK